MLARRGKGNGKAEAMPSVAEKDNVTATHHGGARKVELDGNGRVLELASQGLRHEMM